MVNSSMTLVNVSIDDTLSDPSNGARLSYGLINKLGLDGNGWSVGQNCSTCFAQPDPSQTFDHSWHDASTSGIPGDIPYASVSFSGVAVYVMGILIPSAPSTNDSVNNTRMFFQIDGIDQGSFTHIASVGPETLYSYNATFFAMENLPDGQHNITIMCGDGNQGILSNCLLDRVIYTTSDSNSNFNTEASFSPAILGPSTASASTSSSAPAATTISLATTVTSNAAAPNTSGRASSVIIVGAVIGSTLWSTFVVGLFIICRRRRNKKRSSTPNPDITAGMGVEVASSNQGEQHVGVSRDLRADGGEILPPSYIFAVGEKSREISENDSRSIGDSLNVPSHLAREKIAGTTRLMWP
ncbi:hypothetical protein SCHPADRAFT_940654 [Schizopora paradoxa]|uniref:Uncharacterized protein n=1 Tax=Schizopora paradoxa TaxID=27342 RepID=A0A0H2RN98_9AGAM|nr:hypothetical protein SCHPADRAFT_940654 [Schizopora paradoxa]